MSGGYDIVLWTILVTASATDLIWGKVFNFVTLPACVAGVCARWIVGGYSSAESAAVTVLIAFVMFFPLYRLRVMGAADVKLLMAIGAWSSTTLVLSLAALSIVLGAVVGAYVLVRRIGVKNGLLSVGKHFSVTQHKNAVAHRMPFAPAFLCAFVFLKIALFYHWAL